MRPCTHRRVFWLAALTACFSLSARTFGGDPPASTIDCLLAKHWKKDEIKPAAAAFGRVVRHE